MMLSRGSFVSRSRATTTLQRKTASRFRSASLKAPTPTTANTSEAAATTTTVATSTTTTTGVTVVQSLLAAALGVATVSATAAAVEATAPTPPFAHGQERFDQSTFVGRFSKMLLACDPRLLLYTEQQVRQAQALLESYSNSNNDSYNNTNNTHPSKPDDVVSDNRALWEAQRVVQAALHPDTGDVIPRPFRMSGYVLYNGPVAVAMVASQSTLSLLFWSWVNQSQNAAVNYFNRNASSPMTNETLAKSYAGAVGAALTVAFGLATLINKRYDPSTAQALLRWVAFPSAVVASSLNCYIVRSPELVTGIPLLLDATHSGQQVVLSSSSSDDNNNDTADTASSSRSQIAAARGVYTTTASRALLQAPVYLVPPLLLATVPPLRRHLLLHPTRTVPVMTYLLLTSFGVLGLPGSIALFPQHSSIAAAQLEERFQQLRHPQTQQPMTVFYYNKGL